MSLTDGTLRLIPAHAGKTGLRTRRASVAQAHPRSRGENLYSPVSQEMCRGSSPLTRGKRDGGVVDGDEAGLIPAHAGKTWRQRLPFRLLPAHPRSRGENSCGDWSPSTHAGSSTLTRGKPDRRTCAPRQPRLIPAHAGKTRWAPCERSGCAAHPRSRGENLDSANPHFRTRGSSPLTRGKHSSQVQYQRQGGLIPAHAGKTCRALPRSRSTGAHPRSRGENRDIFKFYEKPPGSSPLTRGKLFNCVDHDARPGLIPAHAGKTSHVPDLPPKGTAHPRSRGENKRRSKSWPRPVGSSPLTRGKLLGLRADRNKVGLIPAHAGKTWPTAVSSAGTAAHPRSRGENLLLVLPSGSVQGSSPLTRGKPFRAHDVQEIARLIPAHAGKTTGRPTGQIQPPAHPRSRGENHWAAVYAPVATGSSPLTRGKRHLPTGGP